MRIARVVFAPLPRQGVLPELAAQTTEGSALLFYRWLLRIQRRALREKPAPGTHYTDFIYYSPKENRLAARAAFYPELHSLGFNFRAEGAGDTGARLDQVCARVFKRHDMAFFWDVSFAALPQDIFLQALALYPQSVVTLSRSGGCAFFSLAKKNYTPEIFSRVRWGTQFAVRDQIKAFQKVGIAITIAGSATPLRRVQDFVRILRELEERKRDDDLVDFIETVKGLE